MCHCPTDRATVCEWRGYSGNNHCRDLFRCVCNQLGHYSYEHYKHTRFQSDNAVGATANAVETLRDTAGATPLFLYGLIATLIAVVDRVRATLVWQGNILLVATREEKSVLQRLAPVVGAAKGLPPGASQKVGKPPH